VLSAERIRWPPRRLEEDILAASAYYCQVELISPGEREKLIIEYMEATKSPVCRICERLCGEGRAQHRTEVHYILISRHTAFARMVKNRDRSCDFDRIVFNEVEHVPRFGRWPFHFLVSPLLITGRSGRLFRAAGGVVMVERYFLAAGGSTAFGMLFRAAGTVPVLPPPAPKA
jgi:hypothetical protein